MTKPLVRDPIRRRPVLDAQIVEQCMRCYITYRPSYRNHIATMADRGIVVTHSAFSYTVPDTCRWRKKKRLTRLNGRSNI